MLTYVTRTMSKGEAEQQVFFSSDADIRSQDADILYDTDEARGRTAFAPTIPTWR